MRNVIRNPCYDITKALMLVWVIWGHLALYGIVEPDCSVYMTNAKIGMNMPVFFMISGLLAASAFKAASWSKLFARATTYMWPQVVYALICASIAAIFWRHNYLRSFVGVMAFWFLHTLFVIYLISAVIFRLLRTDVARWIGFVIVYCIFLFCPIMTSPWLAQVIHMYPYFVFGLMILKKEKPYISQWMAICCGLIFIAIIFLEGNSSVNGMNFWHVSARWDVVLLTPRDFVTFFARTLVGVSGSIFFLWLVETVVKYMPSCGKLACYGTTSLGVYVIHEWVLRSVGKYAGTGMLPFPSWTRWFVAIAYFLLCHFIIVKIKSYPRLKFAFLGNEDMLERKFSLIGRIIVSPFRRH